MFLCCCVHLFGVLFNITGILCFSVVVFIYLEYCSILLVFYVSLLLCSSIWSIVLLLVFYVSLSLCSSIWSIVQYYWYFMFLCCCVHLFGVLFNITGILCFSVVVFIYLEYCSILLVFYVSLLLCSLFRLCFPTVHASNGVMIYTRLYRKNKNSFNMHELNSFLLDVHSLL